MHDSIAGEYLLGSRGYVNCHICHKPVNETENYEFLTPSKFKLFYTKIFGGRIYELRCQSCVRDMKIKQILK